MYQNSGDAVRRGKDVFIKIKQSHIVGKTMRGSCLGLNMTQPRSRGGLVGEWESHFQGNQRSETTGAECTVDKMCYLLNGARTFLINKTK